MWVSPLVDQTLGSRAERANSAIIQSRERGLDWKVAAESLHGGIMDTIPDPDSDGIIAATSEGELLAH